MRSILKLIAILILIFFCSGIVSAQVDTSNIIATTRNYIKYLDSIDKLDHPQNFLYITSVAEGIIKKGDNVIAGFNIYTLLNAKGDTALRIQYHDNLNVNIYKTYYYKSNKLIYAIVKLQDSKGQMKLLYHKEEFYDNDQIIWTQSKQHKKANRYYSKLNFSMYNDGSKFLDDFKKESNRSQQTH